MTKPQLFTWLKSENCEINVKDSFRSNLLSLCVENNKLEKVSYFVILASDDEIPQIAIEKLIKELCINPPKKF